jgi:hypothetical protein
MNLLLHSPSNLVNPLARQRFMGFGTGSSGGPSFVGPLDAYSSNLAGAWSVARRLLTSYSGPLIRIRRSSDSAEQDIGADALGNLDTAALASFVGANSAFVRKVYHQNSGSDLAQTTAANQPRIVNAGTVDAIGGVPAMVFDGSNDFLICSPINVDRLALYSACRNGASIGAYMTLYSQPAGATWSGDLARLSGRWLNSLTSWEVVTQSMTYLARRSPSGLVNTNYLLEHHYNQTSALAAQNGTESAGTALTGNITDSTENFMVGTYHSSGSADSAGLWRGHVGELVFWNEGLDSSDRAVRRSIVNTYWSLF